MNHSPPILGQTDQLQCVARTDDTDCRATRRRTVINRNLAERRAGIPIVESARREPASPSGGERANEERDTRTNAAHRVVPSFIWRVLRSLQKSSA